MSIDILKDKLARHQPVVLDGSFGELARARGVETAFPLWATHALLSANGQQVAETIHRDYFKAGAHVVTTGTFRAQERTFGAHATQHGALAWEGATSPAELSRRAIHTAGQLALQARQTTEQLVAGSLGPLEDSYTPSATPSQRELDAEHARYAEFLAASGVDFVAIETIPTIREGVSAARAAERAGIPYGVSFWGKNGGIGEDETFVNAARNLEHAGLNPLYIGVNCVGLEVADAAVQNLRSATDLPVAVSANGNGDPISYNSWQYTDRHDLQYQAAAQRWLEAGALLVGGCCGTTPATIRSVAGLVG